MTGRLTARWLATGFAALALAASGFAGETDAPWIRGIFTGRSPRPILLAEGPAGAAAEHTAAVSGNALVLVGAGRSMQPLYPAGTLLVLQSRAYALLESGQTVVYRNRRGRPVAHVLVARTRDGWRARGLSNRLHDLEPVHADNLLGVVIAAYVPPAGAPSSLPPLRAAYFLADE